MQFIDDEMARLLAADPGLAAARLRAVRRTNRRLSRRIRSRELAPTH